MKILGFEVSSCMSGELVEDGLAPVPGVRWRTCPAKLNTGMCEMKTLGFEISCCIFVVLVQDGLAPMRGVAWWTVALKLKNGDGWDEIFASQVLLCIKTLVQDAPSQMRSATWRAVAAKFNTGMCEMKILGFEALCCMLGALVHDNFFLFCHDRLSTAVFILCSIFWYFLFASQHTPGPLCLISCARFFLKIGVKSPFHFVSCLFPYASALQVFTRCFRPKTDGYSLRSLPKGYISVQRKGSP